MNKFREEHVLLKYFVVPNSVPTSDQTGSVVKKSNTSAKTIIILKTNQSILICLNAKNGIIVLASYDERPL